MTRLVALTLAAFAWPIAVAPASAQSAMLTWPGKTAAPASSSAAANTVGKPAAALALPRQFFGSTADDPAAPPSPLPPRPVPGTQAAASSANTASNRARQNEILTADSAGPAPTGGAESPN